MDLFSYLLGKKASGGSGTGGLDWTAIGYTNEPQAITEGYNYAKSIYDNWDSSETNLSDKFYKDPYLLFMPMVDTSNVVNMSQMFRSSPVVMCPLLDTENVTNMQNMFRNCYITTIPQFNTSSVTDMSYMFYDCYCLVDVPELDTSSVTTMQQIFKNAPNLSDESLDNILNMCININPSYSRSKTLSEIGFTSGSYSASKIQALPSYQDFIDAGWTIGY